MAGIDRLEAALAKAAAHFVRAKAASPRAGTTAPAHRLLAARLDLPLPDVAALSAAKTPDDLAPTLRARVRDRLERERLRLGRLARSGSARYDLHRHLAVCDGLRWLAGAQRDEAPTDARVSGFALNARFRRSVPRASRATARPSAVQDTAAFG